MCIKHGNHNDSFRSGSKIVSNHTLTNGCRRLFASRLYVRIMGKKVDTSIIGILRPEVQRYSQTLPYVGTLRVFLWNIAVKVDVKPVNGNKLAH